MMGGARLSDDELVQMPSEKQIVSTGSVCVALKCQAMLQPQSRSCNARWVQHSGGICPPPDASAVLRQPVQAHVASEEQQVRALQDRPAQQRGFGHMGRRFERGDDHVLQATPAMSGIILHPAGTHCQCLKPKCRPAALTSEMSSTVQTRALLHLFKTTLQARYCFRLFSGRPDVIICACQQRTHLSGVIAGVAQNVLAPP